MKKISIVLGYGVFVKPQPEYQQYLESVLKDILLRRSDKIIICGGCSNKNHPQLSEAQSINNLYLELHPELKDKIIIEDGSLSTPESLKFSHELISRDYQNPECVTIYCDSCRSPKVFYLALSLFSQNKFSEKERLMILGQNIKEQPDVSQKTLFNFQNLYVVGIPLSDNMTLIANQIMSSMLEMHAFDYPDLHQQFIDWRKKQWGVK